VTKPRAVFLDLATVDLGDLDLNPLKAAPFDWRFHAKTDPGEIAERIRDAELAVSNKVILDRQILRQCPELKLICIAATGTNNVDLEAAAELGIAVTNVTTYATPAVVQHVFALILALTIRLPEYQQAISQGAWEKSDMFCLLDFPIREIGGKTLGIVGLGELGQGVASIAGAFGMEVLVAQRPGGPEQAGRIPLEQLLPRVDVLSLHCPLTEETRNLIGEKELALMKPDALLINTARGGIVDEQALADALRRGELGGAGVDTLSKEPPDGSNPLLQPDIPNLILTPHSAWASRESRQRLLDGVAANIRAFQGGELRNRVA
jgi:glycerate dehydrogenase